MVLAPAAAAICNPKVDTPPVPCSTTVWPGRSGTRAVQGAPRRQRRAREARSLLEGQVVGHARDAGPGEAKALAHQALGLAAELGQHRRVRQAAGDVVLREAGQDAVAGLPLGDALADGLDYPCWRGNGLVSSKLVLFLGGSCRQSPAGAIAPRDDGVWPGKGIGPHGQDAVPPVQRDGFDPDEDLSELGGLEGDISKDQARESLLFGQPVLSERFWGHCCFELFKRNLELVIAIVLHCVPVYPSFFSKWQNLSYL